MILAVDKALMDTRAEAEAEIAKRGAGVSLRLDVRRGAGGAAYRDAEPNAGDAGGGDAVGAAVAPVRRGRAYGKNYLNCTYAGWQTTHSAGYDKVIRVWDVASGKTVRTFRGESAPGDPGKIYAMALSPEGKWLEQIQFKPGHSRKR